MFTYFLPFLYFKHQEFFLQTVAITQRYICIRANPILIGPRLMPLRPLVE